MTTGKTANGCEACIFIMIEIHKGLKYTYFVSPDGIIFRWCKTKGYKEVQKRLGTRGYLEIKMSNKHYSYKREVAKALVPNPNNCDKVFSKDGDQFNTHPSNLRWVWTRENRTFTPEQAIEKATDRRLIECYLRNDRKALRRYINSHFEKLYANLDTNYIGDLYIQINKYAERNLLFDLKTDIIGTYIGLIKQSKRNKLKTITLNEKVL